MSSVILEIHTVARHGFFSAFFGVLRGIRMAEIEGYIPTVLWDSKSPYFHSSDTNAWLHFFEPISNVPPDCKKIRRELCGWDGIVCYPKHSVLETLTILYHKYVRIRPEITSAVPTLPDGLVGIHYRGTDKLRSKEFAAPPVTAVVEMLKNNPVYSAGTFFFATDDIKALSSVKSAFPHLVCNPCIRSSGASIHGHYEYVNEHRTPTKDGPLKGRQVLIDALSLSRCSHIMRCPSGVSLFSIVANPQQTWLDYTEHTWETFLHESPRNIKYYDVAHAQHQISLNENTIWVSNTHRPTRAQLRHFENQPLRDLYAIRDFHEVVNPRSIFDDSTIDLATSLIKTIKEGVLTANQPIITSEKDFIIICSKRVWTTLQERVLSPLYNGKIIVNQSRAVIPLQLIPKFALFALSLLTDDIGVFDGSREQEGSP